MGNYDGQAKETCDVSQNQIEKDEDDEKVGQTKGRHEITQNLKESCREEVDQTNGGREITGNFEESDPENLTEDGLLS